MATLKNYDALVVPSQVMETSPLMVLEAFAAGISVIGSNLGGIKELVQDGVNGFLVEKPTPEAWAKTIQSQSGLKMRKIETTKTVRNINKVAKLIKQKYQQLLTKLSVL